MQAYLFIVVGGVFILKSIFAGPAKAILGCPSNAPMCANTAFLTKSGQSDNITVIHHRQRWPQSFRRVRQSFRPVLPSIQPSDQRSKIARRAVRLAGLVRLVQPSRPPVLLSVRLSTPSVCPTRQTNACDKSDDKSDDQTVGQNMFTLFVATENEEH